MTRRAGVTLTEVLVAIFITGIGLISLLVLFPLAALNMTTALKDQRSADASRIAESLARAWDLANDGNIFTQYGNPAFPAGYSGPSYYAYVDPQGYKYTTSPVGGILGINRVIPSATNIGDLSNAQVIQRWTSLQDELNYDVDGAPKLVGTTVQRNTYYSWAWMLQQNRYSATSPTSGVNMTVIVYYRRPLVPGSATPLEEEVPCSANFSAGTNMVRLTWSGTKPQLKRGSWILSAQQVNTNGTMTAQPNTVYWYRVVNVTPTSGNTADVELHMNARAAANTAVVMDSVVEVFDKGQ